MSDHLPVPPPTPRLEIDDDRVGWIIFDDPDRSLNVFTEQAMDGLSSVLDEVGGIAGQGRLTAVVMWSGKTDSFFAGADVSAIAAVEDPEEGAEASRRGQEVFSKVSGIAVPTIAAVHGVCLGGGLELALSCDFRVVSDHAKTQLGLPEVLLGILPAWGGTTRLPGVVGLQKALDMILTGRNLEARAALKSGLADAVLPWALFREKVADFARARAEAQPLPRPKRGVRDRVLDGTRPGRRLVLRQARKQVTRKTGGHYPAPLKVLEVVSASLGKPLSHGFELEARAAGELIAGSVSKNLIHVFHLREAARKGSGVESDAEPAPVNRMGVVGAGVMGGGIAQLAAHRGIEVRLKDIRHEAVTGALQHAKGLFDGLVRRRRLTPRKAEQRMERISGGLDWAGFQAADLVVEAVVERLEVKRAVLAEMEGVTREDAVLASNTSTLSIDAMSEALARRDRFCGMHFFNPVHKMPLVEVIRGKRTNDRTVATVYALALKMGKVPVVVGDGPGFLVNRILGPYLNEAAYLLGEGAAIEEIDGAALDFGMPMGPLRLIDEIGIDVAGHAGAVLQEAFGDRMAPAAPLVKLGETGRLGRKGGSGFYVYEKDRARGPDTSIYSLLAPTVPASRVSVDRKEIRARLVLSMVNEAALVLADGIVPRAEDVDLAMIMGTGFPPFRGGLLRYADHVHPRVLVERLRAYRAQLGPRFEPAPLLAHLAENGGTFYQASHD
jgi:3-hydroxyacyl-CoA dehydrogenase/enoyl-CoA hydratase/3-hydroxybutyryl-CoA epimerase